MPVEADEHQLTAAAVRIRTRQPLRQGNSSPAVAQAPIAMKRQPLLLLASSGCHPRRRLSGREHVP